MTLKLFGAALLAVMVAFGSGWLLGQSGRSAIEHDRQLLEFRASFAGARALIFEARVDLFLVNFGDASRRLEEARVVVEQVQRRLRELGQAERAGRLEVALAQLRDAQRLAASLDSNAQNAAEEAARTLAAVASA